MHCLSVNAVCYFYYYESFSERFKDSFFKVYFIFNISVNTEFFFFIAIPLSDNQTFHFYVTSFVFYLNDCKLAAPVSVSKWLSAVNFVETN